MMHANRSSPLRAPSRENRRTNSGRACNGSAKLRQPEEITILPDPVSAHYASLYMPKQGQVEVLSRFTRGKLFLIAPDAFTPNSSFRTVFNRKEVKPPETKEFQLRLDILKNLPIDREHSASRDDESIEHSDSARVSKSLNGSKSKGISVSQPKNGSSTEDVKHNKYWTKDTMPQLFKRMQGEAWWKQTKDDKPNLLSMLLYLTEIIKLKRTDSYESACHYLIEIFRNYGIESLFVNQNLDILARHLSTDEKDSLNSCTIRTIAQFMIERKDLIVQLLEYALNFQPSEPLRQEVVDAVKFITDISSSEDIQLAFDNLSVVHDSPEDNFSLKAVIKSIVSMPKVMTPEVVNDGEDDSAIHPLLKKIAKERWFPREKILVTLDYVLETITTKLVGGTKALVKTLTTYLVQLSHVVGYSQEQFDRVSDTLIALLSHSEADYRLIAATNLAHLKRETKSIDIALLDSFVNDPRILVRTECGDSLKTLTGITSDPVLKDCAEDVAFLQTLPAENFTLQNYLNGKNRLPTPPPSPIEQRPSMPAEEECMSMEHVENTTENETNASVAPVLASLPVESVPDPLNMLIKKIPTPISVSPSDPTDLVENTNAISPESHPTRQSTVSIQTPIPIRIIQRRPSISTIATNTLNSYALRTHNGQQNEDEDSREDFDSPSQTTIISNAIQTLLEEHRQAVGFCRMIPNRRVLIPHKISMDHIFGDHSHMIINQRATRLPRANHYASRSLECSAHSMNFFDFNHNQRYLHETESIQLLSSMVVRAIQIHRSHDRFIPGSDAASFTGMLSISPMQFNFPLNANEPSKLPPILLPQPRPRQYAHIQAKAMKEGIDIHKAHSMQDAFSHLLKPNPKPPITSSSTSLLSHSRNNHVTHGWLLIHLLKSQSVVYSESYLQRIMHSYPKFLPLLHTRVPSHLISIIWNDPMMKHIASMFSSRQNDVIVESPPINASSVKPSVAVAVEKQSANRSDYVTLIRRDDQKKKFLPSIRQAKMDFSQPVFKIGLGELDLNSCESSNHPVSTGSKTRFRKRRCYMPPSMLSSSNSVSDHQDAVKSRSRQTWKTDYRITSFLPMISRAPMHD